MISRSKNPNIKTLKSIDLCLKNAKEIDKYIPITTADTHDNGEPQHGGLADRRLGTTTNEYTCNTCHEGMSTCPGHYGVIKLKDPLYNTLFAPFISRFLGCICLKCSKPRLSEKELKALGRNLKGLPLLKILYKHSITKNMCERENGGCGSYLCDTIKINMEKNTVIAETKTKKEDDDSDNVIREQLTAAQVYMILRKISNSDCRLFGLDPSTTRPESIICKNVVVTPVCTRPRVRGEQSQYHEDGQTHVYISLVKQNKKMEQHLNKPGNIANPFEQPMQVYSLISQTTLSCLFGADGNKCAKAMNSQRVPKTFTEVIKGKDGIVRRHLMGKRVDFSARTVITGDPNIGVDEIGVPLEIAMKLTFPVQVTLRNIEEMQRLVDNGKYKYPGANFVTPAKKLSGMGKFDMRDLRYTTVTLRVGDIVARHLQDGDPVLFNRQPTLHKMSIMCHKAIIMKKAQTFRMNLAVCSAYNADFDGDEMNMHVPQSMITREEIYQIAGVRKNVIKDGNSSAILKIIQDAKVGWFLLTDDKTVVDKQIVHDVLSSIGLNSYDLKIDKNGKIKGKDLFSMLIPENINPSSKLNVIVQNMWNQVNHTTAVNFMTDIQKIINRWLLSRGFSVGFEDVFTTEENKESIYKRLTDFNESILEEISSAEQSAHISGITPDILESSINSHCMRILSEVGTFIMDKVDTKNAFYSMAKAEAKGNTINLARIFGCAGIQNVTKGRRPEKTLNGRALPYFCRDDDSPGARGFVFNSFTDGLTGSEFFFSQMAGRLGLIDTALNTAEVGYTYRRITKALEDCVVQHDMSVSTSTGQIIQQTYSTGINPIYMEKEKMDLIEFTDNELKQNILLKTYDSIYTKKVEGILHNTVKVGREKLRYIYINAIGSNKTIMDTTYLVPVALEPIIRSCKVDKTRKKNLKPGYVWTLIQELLDDDNLQTTIPTNRNFVQRNIVFDMFIMTKLNPYQMIKVHQFNKDEFTNLMNIITKRLWRAKIQPGSAVGVIAAQSIGEPLMQLTMNMFHNAGVKSAEQLGLKRMTELLNLLKNLKTPQMILPIIDGKANKNRLVNSLKQLVLKNIVKSTDIYYKVSDDKLKEDNVIGRTKQMKNNSPFSLRFELNRDSLFESKTSVQDIMMLIESYNYAIEHEHPKITKRIAKDIMKGMNNVVVLGSLENEEKSIVYVLFDTDIDPITYQWLLRLKNNFLDKMVMEGLPGIIDVEIMKKPQLSYEKEDSKHVIIQQDVLVTSGINMSEVFKLKGIDFTQMKCNSVLDIFQRYGGEAAASCLAFELEKCFVGNGININPVHISLLADFMTHTGVLTAITRHGFGKLDIDVLKKAAFEDQVPAFMNAAMFSDSDPLTSVSSNIMVGRVPPIGTGLSSLEVDLDKIIAAPFDPTTDKVGLDIPIKSSPIFQDFLKGHKQTFTRPMVKV